MDKPKYSVVTCSVRRPPQACTHRVCSSSWYQVTSLNYYNLGWLGVGPKEFDSTKSPHTTRQSPRQSDKANFSHHILPPKHLTSHQICPGRVPNVAMDTIRTIFTIMLIKYLHKLPWRSAPWGVHFPPVWGLGLFSKSQSMEKQNCHVQYM